MQYLMAIDQGTTSTRSIIFDKMGQVIAMAQEAFEQHYPRSGWVEHDPEEIWQSVVKTGKLALEKVGMSATDIAGIGISNQRETTVLWDKQTGEAIYPAIVWQDRRTAELCNQLKYDVGEKFIREKTGLILDPYFSASKIKWQLDHISNARKRAERGEILFGTIDSYLCWRLTEGKVHKTDITNAARTLLYNIELQQWDEELLQLFNIPKIMLPDVCDNCSMYGETFAFGGAIPIMSMIGDQQAATVGQACFQKGMLKCTYGTGSFLLLNTGNNILHSDNLLLSTIAYRINGEIAYALEGSNFSAGSTLNWLRRELKLFDDPKETETHAQNVLTNGGVYFIPAFAGLGAPYWQSDIRAAIMGISFDTTISHIIRAGLESIAYQTRDLIETMQADGSGRLNCLRVDGGIAKNNWLMQYITDLIDCEVARSKHVETTAWGAAALAGLQAGVYKTLSDIEHVWDSSQTFLPNKENKSVQDNYSRWQEIIKMMVA